MLPPSFPNSPPPQHKSTGATAASSRGAPSRRRRKKKSQEGGGRRRLGGTRAEGGNCGGSGGRRRGIGARGGSRGGRLRGRGLGEAARGKSLAEEAWGAVFVGGGVFMGFALDVTAGGGWGFTPIGGGAVLTANPPRHQPRAPFPLSWRQGLFYGEKGKFFRKRDEPRIKTVAHPKPLLETTFKWKGDFFGGFLPPPFLLYRWCFFHKFCLKVLKIFLF